MFAARKKTPSIRSLIGEGTVIRGPVSFSDGLRIDGEVEGDVLGNPAAPSIVVIGPKARIVGRVKAGHVIISGSVSGPIESDVLVELQPSARVTGAIRYESLEMHPGAVVDGELRPLKHAERPALKLAASNDI
jgi:cytoskeletal protein CcmA (bactofilin family)